MKTLIVARTSRGKDRLRELLETSYGWKFVKSRTTRKPRYDGEDRYVFLSRQEAEHILATTPEDQILAKTEINGDLYFSLKGDFENADAYIIDPNGIKYLCEHYKEEWLEIVYITADKDKADQAALQRAQLSPDPEKEFETYKKRYDAEDDQFTTFEAYIDNQSFRKENCYGIHVVENDYDPDTMVQIAITLEMRRRFYVNMASVLKTLKSSNSFLEHDEKHIHMFRKENNEPVIIRDELFIQLLAEEQKTSMFADLMETYLFRPTSDHPVNVTTE